MAKNEEFLKAIQSVYGNNKLSGRTMRQLKRTWKSNPNQLLNAAQQKDNLRAKEAERQAYQEESKKWGPMQSAGLARSAEMPTKIDYKGPSQKEFIESRLNSGDMGMFSNFGQAFGEARKRGQSEFNWRETGANPSGRFNTQLRPELPEDNYDEADFRGPEPAMERVPINVSGSQKPAPWEQGLFDPVPYPWADQVREQQIPTPRMNMPEMKWEDPFMKRDMERRNERARQLRESEEIVDARNSRRAVSDFERAHGRSPEFNQTSPAQQTPIEYGNELARKILIPRPKGNPGQNVAGESYNKQFPYMQQGGTMGANDQELQKAFMAFLIEDAAAQGMQIQSEQDLQAYAQQLGEEGLKAKYQEFMQKMQGGVKAALGAKLNYIHKLKGNCPDGYEMVYMKEGGRFCPKCMQKASKAKDGKKLNEKKDAIKDFKEKRKQHINPNDTVNTKFGPRDLNGKTKYPKYNANKENYDSNTRMRVQEKDEKSGKKVFGSACGSKLKKK